MVVYKLSALLLLLLLLVFPPFRVVAQGEMDEVYEAIAESMDSEYTTIAEYSEFMSSPEETTHQEFTRLLVLWKSELAKADKVYRKYQSHSDTTISSLSSNLSKANLLGQNSFDAYAKALDADTENEQDYYIKRGDELFEQFIDEHDVAVDYYNDVSGASEARATNDFYKWGTIITGIISFVLWLKSRPKTRLSADQIRSVVYGELFKSSVWAFLGFLITFVWYVLTPPGGTYYILYGLVIFGGWEFLKGLYTYATAGRKQLAMLAKQEKHNLYKKTFSELDENDG